MIAHRSPVSLLPLALTVVVAGAVAGSNVYAAVLLLAAAAATALSALPGVLLPAIVISSVLNRVGLQTGDAQIRLDLITVALVAAVITNRLAVRTLSWKELRSPILPPLLAYAGCNVLSTAVAAQEKLRGFKLDVQILAVVATVVVLTVLVRDRGDLERAIRLLWIVTVAEASIGVILVVLNLGGITATGVQAGSFGLPMAYGTAYEANIFGSLLLGNFFLLLSDYIAYHRSPWHAAGLFVILVGILASETRTAWLGLLIGIAILAALFLRAQAGARLAGDADGRRLLPVLTAIPILAVTAGLLGAATPLAGRITDVVNLHSSSASGRLVIFQAALQDWRAHPFIGLGTGSFNFGAGPGQPHPWLPNLFLLTLHDTGVVGTACLVWLIVRFYQSAFRGTGEGPAASPVAVGAIAGFTGLLIAFQTTSGFWFVYPWIVATLGVQASRPAAQTR